MVFGYVLGVGQSRVTTGWSFKVGNDGIILASGRIVYSANKNTHMVFIDSKPLTTIKALKRIPHDKGFIV